MFQRALTFFFTQTNIVNIVKQCLNAKFGAWSKEVSVGSVWQKI